MLLLPLSSIQIGQERQRREFDEARLQELANSIASVGLQHAVVIRSMGNAGFKLVAGERRLKAIESLRFIGKKLRYGGEEIGEDLIPCVTLGELDELAAEEAELDENIRRVDLTWQERAAAVAKLESLRARQAASRGEPAPRTADIARELFPERTAGRTDGELGSTREEVRRQLIVSKHLDDPEVGAAKSVDDAFKVLKKREETRKNVELAASVGRTFTAELHQAFNEDSQKWLTAYAGELFDCILTDPPYGMGADSFGDSGGRAEGAHDYEDSYENWQKVIKWFAEQSFRVTKPQAHLYAFCDFDRFHEFKEELEQWGWSVFRTPLLWVNPDKSRTPWVDFGPQRKYELCLYANKGRRPVTHIFPDVVSYRSDDNLGHNAQKPVALFVDLLKRCVAPGNLVLDPFAGSGPVFPAAHELKVKAVGVEMAAHHYAKCLKRLEALKAQPELPLSTSLEGLK